MLELIAAGAQVDPAQSLDGFKCVPRALGQRTSNHRGWQRFEGLLLYSVGLRDKLCIANRLAPQRIQLRAVMAVHPDAGGKRARRGDSLVVNRRRNRLVSVRCHLSRNGRRPPAVEE